MWGETGDEASKIGNDDVSETTAKGIPAIVLEEVGAG